MKKKLFMIPFAGGTASSYSVLEKNLNPIYEVIEVDFPGRGKNKVCLEAKDMEELINNLYDTITTQVQPEEEFSILGHSMGAYLAYEIVCKMQVDHMRLPENLIISGAPVYKVLKEDSFYQKTMITKDDVIELVRNNGWINEKLLSSKIFRNFIYKKIYSDLNLMRSFKFSNLVIDKHVKTSVFYGINDKYDEKAYVEWDSYFENPIDIYPFPEGHFFIVNEYKLVTEKLNSIIN